MSEKIGTTNISIPEDWSNKDMSDLVEVTGGKRLPNNASFAEDQTDYPYIRVVDIDENGNLQLNNLRYISESVQEKISKYITESDDVLVSIAGSVGRATVVPEKLDGANITENVARLYNLQINSQYLKYYLNSGVGHSEIKRWTGGGVQDKLALSRVPNIETPVPPRDEQERIASVLYTVDSKVEVLNERYDKLTRLKQALMQDLLTGQTRFDGNASKSQEFIRGNGSEVSPDRFPAGWDLKLVGDVSDVNGSVNGDSDEVDYLPMDALSEELPWPNYTEERNPNENSGTLFKKNDTLVAKITPCTENGKSAFIDNIDSDFGIATTEVITLSPTNINPKYLYYYTESHSAKNYIISRMRGTSGRQRVPKSVFEQELKIPVPPRDEQERIASLLYTVDEMIAKTDELIDKYEDLKRGLMQDLLSGDVRTTEAIEVLDKIQ